MGVDVCHIPRIARLAAHPRFPARILSPLERERFGLLAESERTRFLAVRIRIQGLVSILQADMERAHVSRQRNQKTRLDISQQ
ncbi:hypothetical protein RSAG8_06453, partial [Rhizoctonia solani AG-8 WAC10335]